MRNAIRSFILEYYNWFIQNPCWEGCIDLFYCCFGDYLSSLARALQLNRLAKKIESKTPRAEDFLS